MIKKLFSPVCLIISILILFYIFYRSEIFWGGENRSYYTNFYYISIFLIIFSLITFFLKENLKIYIIITTISIVLVLFLFEAFLSYYGSTTFKDIKVYKNKNAKNYDLRDKEKFYYDLTKKDDQIVVTVYPSTIIKIEKNILPLSGISNSKTIYCNENGYYSVYQSDRYGFNNPDIEWDSNEIEYLLVGDSFTHGACVNRPDDIASVLRKLTNKTVLNLGYGGNGPLLQYAGLREYLNQNVKNVLWLYYEGNDLDDLKNVDLKSKILRSYLENLNFKQDLKLKQNEIDNLGRNIIKNNWKKRNSFYIYKFKKFLKLYEIRDWLRVYSTPIPPQIEPVPEFKTILQLAKNLTIKNNAKLYFVYLPEVSRYKNDSFKSKYNKVKQIVDDLNITFLDMHSLVFEKEEDPLILFPFERRKHYTVEGYLKIAKEIYNSR